MGSIVETIIGVLVRRMRTLMLLTLRNMGRYALWEDAPMMRIRGAIVVGGMELAR